jgi:hypothetical protein
MQHSDANAYHTHTQCFAHIELSRAVAQQKKTHDRLTIFEIEALNVSFPHTIIVEVFFVRVNILSQSHLFMLPMYVYIVSKTSEEFTSKN